jgi:hypothetical protein
MPVDGLYDLKRASHDATVMVPGLRCMAIVPGAV